MLDRGKTFSSSNFSEFAWQDCREFTRLALAGVYTRGAAFRRQLLLKAMNPVQAPPLEIGFDPRPTTYLAWMVERGELAYRTFCVAILMAYVGVVSAYVGNVSTNRPSDTLVFIALGVFAVGAVWTMRHSARERSAIQRFSRDHFTPETVASLLDAPHDKKLDVGIGGYQQRLLVYRDYDPFRCAGAAIGRWSFTVDVEKRAQIGTGAPDLVPISLSQINQMIAEDLPQSGFGDMVIRKIAALRGRDAWTLPLLSHDAWTRQPSVTLNESAVADVVAKHPDLVREYLLFHDIRWNGELILTHAIKTTHRGRIFYIEASRYLLTPPFKEFKTVDNMHFSDRSLRTKIGRLVGEAMASPFLVLGEVYNLLAYAMLGHSIRRLKTEYRHSIEATPLFDYGAVDSTRREIMDENFEHYFQKTDLDFGIKAFDQCVVELICRYMEDHGVDISDLRKKAFAIYNSGILVQGGDVTAQAMAVGQGASAASTHDANATH
ncbi:hypothetical protein [uncultured Bradyrhizobium sp.]|jgi:hypothetical protein|uniref:hypothetical protein n=1 Tax=uncultured Bradyrhizobium sp. TaxID=199684 RepID=UPI00263020AE|nr:hypothetical protein [uncultured Bradyrhizobium sp.]